MRERIKDNKLIIWLCMLMISTLITSGCAKYYSYAYKTDIANAGDLKIIALAPIELSLELPQGDKVRAFFDTTVSEKLSSAGFQVIGSAVFSDKMAALVRERGGVYDSVTGKRDEEKFQDLQKTCKKDLLTTTGANALLRTKVVVVSAFFWGCHGAKWDGVQQDVSTTFLIFCANSNMHGRVPAFSLLITLEDSDGKILYFNGGGIELASRYVSNILMGRFEQVPIEELLIDEIRNRHAVELSLAPLLLQVSKKQ
ncbi:MAG TPA: hypothetical protein VLX29_03730 [Nitrospirota bacterium]|nr:hypothetical protein [Nitrospirota bacterium]